MNLAKTVLLKLIKYPMDLTFLHYGDVLKRVERVILSCKTSDQVAAAWKYADLFEEHCKRIGVNDETRIVMRSTVNNLLEDQWETVRLQKLNQTGDGC